MANVVVFSRNEYGAYTATPHTLIVHAPNPTTEPVPVELRNYTDQPILITPIGNWAIPPARAIDAGATGVLTIRAGTAADRYFYSGSLGPALGQGGYLLQGGSGPGIIVTP